MAGNKEGAAKIRQKQIERYGSYEAYLQAMRERASLGGKNGLKENRTFYKDRELAKRASDIANGKINE